MRSFTIEQEMISVHLDLAPEKLHERCILSSGGSANDVFAVHGDKMVYDDCEHSKDTEGVGERVQSIVGDHRGGRSNFVDRKAL
jgi:hypothetical protein